MTAARILVRRSQRFPQTSAARMAVRYHMRTITWNGRAYRFEAMPADPRPADIAVTSRTTEWAVSSQREFIGAMACPADVTTAEFDLRCERWLVELIATRPAPPPPSPAARPSPRHHPGRT